jgi:hypothetical protein
MPDVAIGEPRLLAHPADERLRHTRMLRDLGQIGDHNESAIGRGAGTGRGACAAACPARFGYRRLKTGTSPSGRRTSIARGRPGWRCTHPLASNSVSW